MSYSLLIDVVVALLLVVTIAYAVKLNKRLGMLRRDKAELEKLATTFAESTVRADDSLGRLRSTADMMQGQIVLAQALHDDLVFLLDRGEKTADRLEDAVRVSRDFDRQPKKSTASAAPNASGATPAKSAPGIQHLPSREIEDVNEGMPRPAPTVTPRETDEISSQTEAERELLKALRSAN